MALNSLASFSAVPTVTLAQVGSAGDSLAKAALVQLIQLAPVCFNKCITSSSVDIPGIPDNAGLDQQLCAVVTSTTAISRLESCIAGACGKSDLSTAGNFLVQNAGSVAQACVSLQMLSGIANAAAETVPANGGGVAQASNPARSGTLGARLRFSEAMMVVAVSLLLL
ncbi:hypothetical protein BJ741DRAFT_589052 [Chytriomyces cf. hyalinus JEL632]|nr:hypothetical protein BJ741DRAFT_589052 [Chytriomyces cf. hyalinus JEL632]